MGLLRDFRVERRENSLYITGNGNVNVDILVEFSGVYVDVNDLSLLAENGGIAGNAVGEARADSYEKVAVVERVSCLDGSVHSEHAYVAAVGLVVSALTHQRAGNWRVGQFCERLQLC